jgi:hypothetical protein
MFPLLHFLLPPGEENRGKGLRRTKAEGTTQMAVLQQPV